MKVRNKGFTITELVIVIAVIAILAAVLIPTFSNVIEKANQTAASSSCNVALSEYITMVTLDSDPDNNDATGVVFSNDNYYYVYSGGKLHYIGNTEKDSAKLLAVTSYDTDISALTGFYKQPPVEEGTAVYDNKIKFTIGEQTVEVDLTDTTRTLYLYNVDIDGTIYAGFFTINNTYGGSGNVIQTVNYSYQSGISQDEVAVGQVEVSEEVELVLESISAEYLSQVPIYTGDNKTITPEEVKVTASYVGGIVQVLSSNLYTLKNATVNTESAGQHTVTVVYSEGTSITTTFSVDVGTKQTKTIHYYNDLGWANPWAYVWYEEYIPVKPGVGDIVLMGSILGTENAWKLESSIKMFYDSNTNQYVVKGLRIEQGEQFKIAKILESGVQYYNLNEANSDYKYSFDTYNDSNLYNTNNGDQNITINAGGLYDIYFKSGNVLYIEKSKDQTAENRPNVAIISTYSDGGWPGKEMTKEGNLGLWTVEVDARATYVVFNDESKDAVIGINKTVDIEISSNAENIYYDGGWHSEYTMYYFYNAHNWNEVYANATTTEPIALMSTSTSTDIGIRMTAVEGKPGWFAVPVASGCETIVFNNGDVNGTVDNNDCVEVEINTQNQTDVYYNPNNATAEGGGWSSSIKTTTYYFYNAAGWEKVYAHYWVEDGPGTTWHGVEMTPVDGEDGWFSIDIDDNFEKVVFNDGLGEVEGINKTVNLILSPSTPYCSFENWYSEMPTMVTYYFYNVNNWENVYAYAWTGEEGSETKYLGNFPGVQMQALGNGWWSIAVDSSAKYIIFNKGSNGAGNQTGNLTLNSATPYFDGYEWKDEQTTHQHRGGTATCTEHSTCEVCGQEYGELGSHSLQYVESVQPTCTNGGIIEHWKCTLCEKLFSDSGAENVITDVTAPATGHNPSSEWTSDEIYHWHECANCEGQQYEKAEHSYDNACDTDCNVCDKVRETTHNYEVKHDETNHWEECSVCHDIKADSKQAHTFELNSNEEQHWNECSVCGYIDETSREEHSYTDGKCECGADEPAEPVVLESIKATFTTEGTLFVNTELTASDFTVTKVMSNGEEEKVSDTENIYVALKEGSTNATQGQAIYVITYGGKTTEVTVTFTKKLTGITAVATETTVEHGGTLDLTVTASYDGGEDQVVTGFTTDFINTMDGLQKVTVTYVENGITVTTTVNVVVNPTGYKTYYFYNYAGWTDVRAHAWSEEIKGEQPAIGEKVLICKTPDGIEYSFKLTLINNEYVIQGLYLPEETSVKVGKLEDDGDYFYYTLKEINEGTSTGKGTTELKLITTGVHDFYFSENYNNDKLWINKVEGNSSELPYFKKVIEFKAWPGTAMQDMGNGWWCVSVDAKAENIIFNGAIGDTRYQTDNLTLNPVTPYYCINGWKDTPDISDIIVFDLTEADNYWITTSPRFAVYLFNGESSAADNNGMWLDMTAIAGNSVNYYYAVDISGLDYSKFTVCRMNPGSTENNWDNKWNQTVDLQLENGLCVKIKGWSTIEQSSFAKGSVTREV